MTGTVRIAGSDSCAKNTGHLSGVAACLEKKHLKRPLQRVLCMKHIIELLWKRYFKLIDGGTKGPDSFDSPIGKQISNEELRFKDIVNFKKMKGGKVPNFSPEAVKNLKEDQRILYHFYKAATTGPEYFNEHVNLRTIQPGKLHNAR